MRDGVARLDLPPELLSFSDWAAVAAAARDAIDASPLVADIAVKGETDEVKAEVKKLRDEIKWVWPKVREHLTKCGVLIGPSGIEIRPYHPPTALNAGYSHAKQRIYLSATLGSMDDLQRRVGGGQVTRLVTDQPLPAGTTGERMFVLNPSSAEALDPDVLDWALGQAQAAGGKAAWLCASHSEADTLQAVLGGADSRSTVSGPATTPRSMPGAGFPGDT